MHCVEVEGDNATCGANSDGTVGGKFSWKPKNGRERFPSRSFSRRLSLSQPWEMSFHYEEPQTF